MKDTILIAGIHGVGKTYYCSLIKDEKFEHITASTLIKRKLNKSINNTDKKVKSVDDNQKILIDSFCEIREEKETVFLFDGHFVLLDSKSNFQKIGIEVFKAFNLSKIILLVDDYNLIFSRLKNRDTDTKLTVEILKEMQELELEQAKEISKGLKIPLEILKLQENQSEQKFVEILSKYI